MKLPSVYIYLGTMSLRLIVASLEAMPCIIIARNPPSAKISPLK